MGLNPLGGDNTAFIDQVAVQNITANQPIDPGFESPAVGTSAYAYDPSGSPWTFSGYAGVTGNGSAFTAGNPNAPQGSQAAFIQMTGSVSQSVALAAGTYSISLDAAQRAIGSSNQTIEVLIDNVPLGSFTPGSTNYALFTTTIFYEPAGVHTIEILGLDPHGGDNTALIDQVSVVAAQANQPADPGFENPLVGAYAFQYDPSGSPWTFSGDAGITGNGSGFTANNPNAPEGSQAAFIQMTGSASQLVTLSGGSYAISLDAAQRAIGSSNQTIEVLIDDALVGTITPSSINYSLHTTATFYEPAGAHTIEILGLDPLGGDNTALVDAVSIITVQANQPIDPGFETPALGPSAYEYDPANSPWTFSGYAGLTGNASTFTAANPNAPQGSQVAFIQMTGSVSQSFVIAPGIYDVNLLAAERGDVAQPGQTIQVLVDGQVVSDITPSGTSYASYTSGSFVIGAGGTHTLTFLGLDPFGGDNTAFIDDVSVLNVTANQPLDAGFESPFVGPSAYQYNATGSAWTFSGDAGVAGNGSGFTASNPNAPQGSQVAFIQITGSASQSVTLSAGTYSISLDAAQRHRLFESDDRGAGRRRGRQQHHACQHQLLAVHDGDVHRSSRRARD